MKIYNNIKYLIIAGIILCISSCKEDDITTNDIHQSLVRSEIHPLETTSVEAGTEYTISGTNLDIVTNVTLSGNSVEIISQDATTLTFQVPRIFAIGPVSITNKYKQVATTEETVAPIYGTITVESWPAEFEVGKPIELGGTNVHLINKLTLTITEVNTEFHPASLVGTTFETAVNGSSSNGSTISIPTRDFAIPYGATVVATVSGLGAIVGNENSPPITAIKPVETFEAVDPVVLWDFEDGINPYNAVNASASINGGTVGQALGDGYLHIKSSNADGDWTKNFGSMITEEINLGSLNFNKPYISFMVNTSGARGYMDMWITQGGVGYEAHFNNDPDDYAFDTDGWEWRSYTLTPTDADAGEWKTGGFDPMQPFVLELRPRSGNINEGNFELNLDHVMITDGAVRPVVTQSFESSVPGFGSKNGGTMDAVHLNDYFHFSYNVAGDWSKQGEVLLEGPFNLGDLEQPYLNFWINTGGGTAFFQLVTSQNGVTFGHDPNGYEVFNTGGEWELITINLADVGWGNWSETEDAFDPRAVSDFFRIDFNPGNQASGLYEFNIDGLILSDGPMFYYPADEE